MTARRKAQHDRRIMRERFGLPPEEIAPSVADNTPTPISKKRETGRPDRPMGANRRPTTQRSVRERERGQ